MPKVSVILPVYNGENYLSAAIESVFRQTFRDFELIIVDDGSSDGSGKLARGYAERRPERVIYVGQPNRGPGAARNAGLRRARGEYVTFIDADDLWDPTKLAKQAALLDADSAIGFVSTDFFFIDAEGRVAGRDGDDSSSLPQGEITLELLDHFCLYPSTLMIRKACAERAGYFREDIRVAEDYDFVLRLSVLYRAGGVREKLLAKRMRTDSLSSDRVRNSLHDLEVVTAFIRANPSFFKAHRRITARTLWGRNFSAGYWLLRTGEKRRSLPYLLRSLRYRPTLKAVKCLGQAALPHTVVAALRRRLKGEDADPAAG